MKNSSLKIISILVIIFFISCMGNKNNSSNNREKETKTNKNDSLELGWSNPLVNGYIPDTTTAMKIAEAIWLPIYGSEIYEYLPFKAILINESIWKVSGTVHTSKGGSPFAFVKKKDGLIIEVYHEE
jgi:NTF2 fold immunity protein of polymorphic toxin system component